MKVLSMIFAAICIFSGCCTNKAMVEISNVLQIDREEIVSLPIDSLIVSVAELNKDNVVVFDANNQQITSQIIECSKTGETFVVFKANVAASSVSKYTIKVGKADQYPLQVFARHVPERADDFAWENMNIAYRAYGKGLEKELFSPGFDVWVKSKSKLVIDQWFEGATKSPGYYHQDRGEGKDCYKVSSTLGGGASSPLVNGELCFPELNYRSFEDITIGPLVRTFALNYLPWNVDGKQVSLKKIFTVDPVSNFCKATDIYSGDFDSLTVAAGIINHKVISSSATDNSIVIYEVASDTKKPEIDGNIGLAVFMPNAESAVLSGPSNHSILTKTIKSGEALTYYFGSCWSKGNIKDNDSWTKYVKEFIDRVSSPLSVSYIR